MHPSIKATRVLIINEEYITLINCIKQLDYFRIIHFDAASAKRLTYSIPVVCAVDVNIAIIGVASRTAIISRLQASQADDACCDQVPLLLFCRKLCKVSYRDSSFENHTFWFAITNFIGKCMQAQWRSKRILNTGRWIPGGGYRKSAAQAIFIDKRKFLMLNGNN